MKRHDISISLMGYDMITNLNLGFGFGSVFTENCGFGFKTDPALPDDG